MLRCELNFITYRILFSIVAKDATTPGDRELCEKCLDVSFDRDPRFKVGNLGSEESSVLTSDKILEEIKKNPKITANQLASALGIT